jgi:hypothetical protein
VPIERLGGLVRRLARSAKHGQPSSLLNKGVSFRTLVVCSTLASLGKSLTPTSSVLMEESRSARDSRREDMHPSRECAMFEVKDALKLHDRRTEGLAELRHRGDAIEKPICCLFTSEYGAQRSRSVADRQNWVLSAEYSHM